MKVKELISTINDYPEADIDFYICDEALISENSPVKLNGDKSMLICSPSSCKIYIPYNFLEGNI